MTADTKAHDEAMLEMVNTPFMHSTLEELQEIDKVADNALGIFLTLGTKEYKAEEVLKKALKYKTFKKLQHPNIGFHTKALKLLSDPKSISVFESIVNIWYYNQPEKCQKVATILTTDSIPFLYQFVVATHEHREYTAKKRILPYSEILRQMKKYGLNDFDSEPYSNLGELATSLSSIVKWRMNRALAALVYVGILRTPHDKFIPETEFVLTEEYWNAVSEALQSDFYEEVKKGTQEPYPFFSSFWHKDILGTTQQSRELTKKDKVNIKNYIQSSSCSKLWKDKDEDIQEALDDIVNYFKPQKLHQRKLIAYASRQITLLQLQDED